MRGERMETLSSISRFRCLFLITLLLMQAGCATARLHDDSHAFQLQGLERSYLVHAPAGASALSGKRPLVLVLHGGGGTARGMLRLTRGRFDELADRYGFYVVYPEAIDKYWDFGEGRTSADLDHRRDDLTYFSQVLARMEAAYPIDETRIFATGISRGGQASYFLACKLPGRIRAIAPFAMPLPEFLKDDCRQGAPVPIALFNGTADPLVPYDGGMISFLGQMRDRVLSTDETLALWGARNGCPRTADDKMVLDRADDDGQVEHLGWHNCSGAPMELYRIVNGGHTWPSGIQYLPSMLVGKVNRDIDGADEAWRFFSRF
jgi:polyhydroxybutyrate depolymerase